MNHPEKFTKTTHNHIVKWVLKERQQIPPGLPPIRGIEHQIDLIPGASLPNRVAYRANPEETKEIQRQFQDLLDRGYVRESLSHCFVPVILVQKKDGSWRMCAELQIIEPLTTSPSSIVILFLD